MSFFRREVVDFALDQDADKIAREQREWIAREPGNAKPYYQLAQIYRMRRDQDSALGLLLEAVRLDPALTPAHVSLTEIYIVRNDYPAAWRHARAAESSGNMQAVELLLRYQIAEPSA
jgi:cytochrome c-type biogenesis protein CcmH/NrfG